MIKDFLLFGKVTKNIQVGKKIIPSDKNLELILKQDKDSPALYRFLYNSLVFEIHCIQGIIMGISIKFDDNPLNNKFFFDKESKIKLKTEMYLKKFISYIDTFEYKWQIDKLDTRDKSLAIVINNNAKVMYNLDSNYFGIYQVIYFDNNLYNDLLLQQEVK